MVSLLILAMTFGVVDLGRGVYARTALTNAVRAAARYGATAPEDYDGMIAAVVNTSPGLDLEADADGFVASGGSVSCNARPVAYQPKVTNMPLAPVGLMLGGIAPFIAGQAAAAAPSCLQSYSYYINGIQKANLDSAQNGDHVRVTFTITTGCSKAVVTLNSYITNGLDGSNYEPPYDSDGGSFGTGPQSIEVTVPPSPYNFRVVFNFEGIGTVPPTKTPTPVATATRTATATNTPTPNVAATATAGAKKTQTAVARTATACAPTAQTATAVVNETATAIVNATQGYQATSTANAKATATAEANLTATALAPTATNTPTPANTATPTNMPTRTPIPTATPITPETEGTPDPEGPGPDAELTPGYWATQTAITGGPNILPSGLNCTRPTTGNLLTFCAVHDFQMVAPKLIGFGEIQMTECATVDIQNVP